MFNGHFFLISNYFKQAPSYKSVQSLIFLIIFSASECLNEHFLIKS